MVNRSNKKVDSSYNLRHLRHLLNEWLIVRQVSRYIFRYAVLNSCKIRNRGIYLNWSYFFAQNSKHMLLLCFRFTNLLNLIVFSNVEFRNFSATLLVWHFASPLKLLLQILCVMFLQVLIILSNELFSVSDNNLWL